MTDALAIAMGWGILAIAFFTFLSIQAWSSARRREREAYYKAEAIKKIAEMQAAVPEPVLQVLRETMASWKETPSMASMGPVQAKAYYKAETMRHMAQMQGAGSDAVLTMLREEERVSARRVREGLRLGGFITCAVGVGLMVALRAMVPDMPVYLVGLIPLLVGVVLLAAGFVTTPRD